MDIFLEEFAHPQNNLQSLKIYTNSIRDSRKRTSVFIHVRILMASCTISLTVVKALTELEYAR